MISRVFQHSDLPCRGRFVPPGGSEIVVEISHLSMEKGVLAYGEELPVGEIMPLHIQLPDEGVHSVMARVVRSGVGGLYVELLHDSESATSAFGTRLIEAAENLPAATDSSDDEDEAPEEETPEVNQVEETVESAPSSPDLRSSILQRTRTVDAQKLAERNQHVRVVNMSTITSLIEDALADALAASDRSFDAAARAQLLEETEAGFAERLAILQAEKAGAEEQLAQLRDELTRAEATLEEERNREISTEQFTVSAAGMDELDTRLGRLIDQSLRSGEVDSAVEEQMRAIVAQLLDDEREKIRERAQEAQSDAISLLERKVGRLAQTLNKSEKAREIAEHRAAALEAAGGNLGLKNVLDAGLHPDDPTHDRKLALLEEIVKENDTVRAFIESGKSAAEPEAPAEPVGGVKKIAVKRVKPPPLLRSESSEPETNSGLAAGATNE